MWSPEPRATVTVTATSPQRHEPCNCWSVGRAVRPRTRVVFEVVIAVLPLAPAPRTLRAGAAPPCLSHGRRSSAEPADICPHGRPPRPPTRRMRPRRSSGSTDDAEIVLGVAGGLFRRCGLRPAGPGRCRTGRPLRGPRALVPGSLVEIGAVVDEQGGEHRPDGERDRPAGLDLLRIRVHALRGQPVAVCRQQHRLDGIEVVCGRAPDSNRPTNSWLRSLPSGAEQT